MRWNGFLLGFIALLHGSLPLASVASRAGRLERAVTLLVASLVLQSAAWAWLWGRKEKGISHVHLRLAVLVSLGGALSVAPFLETDSFRYLWDGFVTAKGISPWLYAPKVWPGAELLWLREKINFPELVTVYPIGASWIFALFSRIAGEDHRVFTVLLSLGGYFAAAWSLFRWARKRNIRSTTVGLVLVHPLLIREWVHAAHYDSWMMAFLLLSASCDAAFFRGLLAGVSAQIKVLSAVVGLAEIRSGPPGKRQEFAHWLTGFFLAVAILFASGELLEGFRVWDPSRTSWGIFARNWEMNAGPARWLRELWMATTGDYDQAREGSRGVMAVGYLGLACWLGLRWKRSRESLAFWLLLLAPWLSPLVNTWYLTWSLVFLPALPASRTLAWLWVPVAFGDFFYVVEHPPLLSIESWWNLEHLWVAGVLGVAVLTRYRKFGRRGYGRRCRPNRRC